MDFNIALVTAALLAAARGAACLPLEYECSLDSRSMWRGYEGNQLDADDFQAFMELVGGGGKPARSVAAVAAAAREPEPASCSRSEEEPVVAAPVPCESGPSPPAVRRRKGRDSATPDEAVIPEVSGAVYLPDIM